MKIAFCLFKYFPFGGLQRDFIRIIRECVRRGHEVEVFTMVWEGELEPGVCIHIVPVRGLQNHARAAQFIQKIQPRLLSYDVVVGFNRMPGLDVYYAADVCYQARARERHAWWYRLTPRYRQWMSYEKAVFSPEAKTRILLLAKARQQAFIDCYHTPITRFQLLPPGISKDRIAPENAADIRREMRLQYGIAQDELLVLFVGSGFKTKGLDRALRSLATLPSHLKNKVHFYVIGKDHPSVFQREANEACLTTSVKFLGGRHDVPRFLLAADLLFHPAYYENAGAVLLEALTAGLPVLTTEVCGYAHYVKEAKAGIVLSSPFKQAECDAALAKMLTLSPNERSILKKNALSFAKKADIYNLPEKAVDAIVKP